MSSEDKVRREDAPGSGKGPTDAEREAIGDALMCAHLGSFRDVTLAADIDALLAENRALRDALRKMLDGDENATQKEIETEAHSLLGDTNGRS